MLVALVLLFVCSDLAGSSARTRDEREADAKGSWLEHFNKRRMPELRSDDLPVATIVQMIAARGNTPVVVHYKYLEQASRPVRLRLRDIKPQKSLELLARVLINQERGPERPPAILFEPDGKLHFYIDRHDSPRKERVLDLRDVIGAWNNNPEIEDVVMSYVVDRSAIGSAPDAGVIRNGVVHFTATNDQYLRAATNSRLLRMRCEGPLFGLLNYEPRP